MEIVKLSVKKNGVLMELKECDNLVGLERMYKLLKVDDIDIVQVRFPGLKGIDMIVDDEGALKANPKINIVGSVLAGQPIWGNVLLTKQIHTEDGISEGGFEPQEINNLLESIELAFSLGVRAIKKERMK